MRDWVLLEGLVYSLGFCSWRHRCRLSSTKLGVEYGKEVPSHESRRSLQHRHACLLDGDIRYVEIVWVLLAIIASRSSHVTWALPPPKSARIFLARAEEPSKHS